VVRTKRLAAGDRHADVEAAIAACTTTVTTMALALFDNAGEGSRVLPHVDSRFGGRAADALRACKEGAHGGHDGPLVELVRDVEQLVDRVRRGVYR
jgi:hypothetical protein